jgi:hypothetical protein
MNRFFFLPKTISRKFASVNIAILFAEMRTTEKRKFTAHLSSLIRFYSRRKQTNVAQQSRLGINMELLPLTQKYYCCGDNKVP